MTKIHIVNKRTSGLVSVGFAVTSWHLIYIDTFVYVKWINWLFLCFGPLQKQLCVRILLRSVRLLLRALFWKTKFTVVLNNHFFMVLNFYCLLPQLMQGWTLALARSPRRVSKVSGECKSQITRPFGECDFSLLRNWLNCTIYILFCQQISKHKLTTVHICMAKFYTPNCPKKGRWSATLGFAK